VLAVGDEPFQRKCMDRIHGFQAEGRTIVIVSHALDQIAQLCDRAVVLEHGNLRVDGDPLEALRYLRADFEVMRQEDRERSRAVELDKTSAAGRVHSVELVDDAGLPLRQLRPGDSLTVVITVDAAALPANWALGMGIATSLGVGVFTTHTRMMGTQMPALTGRRSFEVRLPQVWLGEGTYGVQATIFDDSFVEVDKLTEATTFTVESDGRSSGTLYIPPEMLVR